MADIKAIETYYKGYRFRSRLEARWAVFFDALGVRYEYEPEGYYTQYGGYLPDFFLPGSSCFVEIKGVGAFDISLDGKNATMSAGRESPHRFAAFMHDVYKEHPVLICFGDPWDAFLEKEHGGNGNHYLFYEAECLPKQFGTAFFKCENGNCDNCKNGRGLAAITSVIHITDDTIYYLERNDPDVLPVKLQIFPVPVKQIKTLSELLPKESFIDPNKFLRAIKESRQARFEHGEKPNL